MMNANIKRHAYTDYTGKSYMSQFGMPYNKISGNPCMNPGDARTIIRTNQPQNIINDNGAWASGARKDNLYQAYASRC